MTGLFFGSFNPIHTGHLIIANYMREYCSLDEVWFIVSPQNPFKEKNELLDPHHRLKMVELAIAGDKKLKANDVEFKLPQPSYTVDTLLFLRKKYPKKKFAIIMGSDNLKSIHRWKDYETILKNFSLLIYKRKKLNEKKWSQYRNVQFFDTPFLNISSTMIRIMIADKKSVRYMVPEKVREYISRHHLYQH